MFHHPLIRTVAYESQLKSDRAELHRRLAAAIQERDPESLEENAALIAEHFEAAGELHGAYAWHMRAGAWSAIRDMAAARVSWERARQIADSLPADADRTAMRIAPRALLCGSAFRVHAPVSASRFEELRELCEAAGDKASLAIGMAGLLAEHMLRGRVREASQLASDHMALIESIDDPISSLGCRLRRSPLRLKPARWTTCCGGRKKSLTWPAVTLLRGICFGDHLCQPHWQRAAAPGGAWVDLVGATI